MVVQAVNTLQVLRITPRLGNILFFDIYNELTKETTRINSFTLTEQPYFFNVLLSYDFTEGGQYTIKAIGTDEAVRFYSKIYATNQTPEEYKILDGKFITKDSDNSFITI